MEKQLSTGVRARGSCERDREYIGQREGPVGQNCAMQGAAMEPQLSREKSRSRDGSQHIRVAIRDTRARFFFLLSRSRCPFASRRTLTLRRVQ